MPSWKIAPRHITQTRLGRSSSPEAELRAGPRHVAMTSTTAVALEAVLHRIRSAAATTSSLPRLVAVSKTKPADVILEAYSAGQRHFGENYAQELVDKAPALPRDIAWHFIGQLQSNKCNVLVREVPNLWAVESVDSARLATKLDHACEAAGRSDPLRVFVQVNTSDEEQKGGCAPSEAVGLATHIVTACPRLSLLGLMTLGKLDEPARVYFERLVTVREEVARALDRSPESLELSMGMSADFELAIACGASNVRVGSQIFGAREPKPAAAAAAAATTSAAAGAPA